MVVLSSLGYFLPIFSFLLVFLIIYAVLIKTKLLGDNLFVPVLISFILSSFFIFNASLVEFIQVSSSWIVVFAVCLFFLLVLLTFGAGKISEAMNKNLASAILAGVVLIFVISSSYVFNWVIKWDVLEKWAETKWFGLILLLIIVGVVSWILTKKS